MILVEDIRVKPEEMKDEDKIQAAWMEKKITKTKTKKKRG